MVEKAAMVFEINEKDKFLSKIIARDSSVGCSSRISYYRSGEGVPFKWEMQPGIAKEPPKEELPPLTPPPAILSLGLPKPCFQDPKPSTRSRLVRFWKKRPKTRKGRRTQECLNDDDDDDVIGFDIFARLDQFSSDSECVASPRGSSFSSSSSLSLVKGRPSVQSTGSESPIREVYGKPLSCFPMPFNRILVSIARRD